MACLLFISRYLFLKDSKYCVSNSRNIVTTVMVLMFIWVASSVCFVENMEGANTRTFLLDACLLIFVKISCCISVCKCHFHAVFKIFVATCRVFNFWSFQISICQPYAGSILIYILTGKHFHTLCFLIFSILPHVFAIYLM